MYTPFGRQGTIRQQDHQACNITRSAIARSLALEALETAMLVSVIISKIQANQLKAFSIEDLWNHVQNDSKLRSIARKTDANVDDYSQFAGWVNGERRNLASEQKRRMDEAIGFRIFTARFGNCARLSKLHLVPAGIPA